MARSSNVTRKSSACGLENEKASTATYVCKVTPSDRRSCTLSTLEMALRPKSSKQRTFQMGSPSELRMEAGARGLLASSVSGVSSFRLRIFLKAAVQSVSESESRPKQDSIE